MTSRTLQQVQTRLKHREAVGTLKYGCTVDRRDLKPVEWVAHAQEEAMDLCLYLERLREALPLLHEARALMTFHWDAEFNDWCERYDELFGDETREE